MTHEQFEQLILLLAKIANFQYTLTDAADWPLLVALAGVIALCLGSIIGLLVYIHKDLKLTIKEKAGEWKEGLDKEEKERKEAVQLCWDGWREEKDNLWTEMEKCQADCCPRGNGNKG